MLILAVFYCAKRAVLAMYNFDIPFQRSRKIDWFLGTFLGFIKLKRS